jgi:RimJ/RimL family protein N-acetyltransferase
MSAPENNPAYRLQTERMVIRCWQPADAALLKEAIDASLDHLRPWMPWAENEPEPLPAKVQRLRSFRGKFDLGQDFVYGIFNLDESRVLGGTGLHPRLGAKALEIGYWIRADTINRGLATEATAALTRVAFTVNQVNRVEIHCDPANQRSAAVPRKLGYRHEATLRRRILLSDNSYRDLMIWTLFSSDYPDSPAAAYPVTAWDVSGDVLAMEFPN